MHLSELVNLLVMVVLWAPLSVVLTQALKRVGWPTAVKAVLAIACAALIGIAGTWVSGDLLGLAKVWGDLTATDVVAYVGIVYAAASVWYTSHFGDTDWMKRLAQWPR
jgi:hypothetical protein